MNASWEKDTKKAPTLVIVRRGARSVNKMEEENEDLFWKKKESSRQAMTTEMNAIISQNNIALRQDLKRNRDAVKICIFM